MVYFLRVTVFFHILLSCGLDLSYHECLCKINKLLNDSFLGAGQSPFGFFSLSFVAEGGKGYLEEDED